MIYYKYLIQRKTIRKTIKIAIQTLQSAFREISIEYSSMEDLYNQGGFEMEKQTSSTFYRTRSLSKLNTTNQVHTKPLQVLGTIGGVVDFLPYSRKEKTYLPIQFSTVVPVERKVVDYVPFKSYGYIPVQKTYSSTIPIQRNITYAAKVTPARVLQYAPVQTTNYKLQYVPMKKQTVYRPMSRVNSGKIEFNLKIDSKHTAESTYASHVTQQQKENEIPIVRKKSQYYKEKESTKEDTVQETQLAQSQYCASEKMEDPQQQIPHPKRVNSQRQYLHLTKKTTSEAWKRQQTRQKTSPSMHIDDKQAVPLHPEV